MRIRRASMSSHSFLVGIMMGQQRTSGGGICFVCMLCKVDFPYLWAIVANGGGVSAESVFQWDDIWLAIGDKDSNFG